MKAIQAYLIFDGNCREAMEFYRSCLGGELSVMTYGEAPIQPPPGAEKRVIHARLAKGDAVLMASDGQPGQPPRGGDHVWLSIHCESAEEIERIFEGLSVGSRQVTMPLQETFWAARFAMFTDRFGVHWMLNLDKPVA